MIRVLADAAIPGLAEALSGPVSRGELTLTQLPAAHIKASELKGMHALITRSVTQVDSALLAQADQLKLIATATVGMDHIDASAIGKHIEVISAAGCSRHAVSQYVIRAIHELRPELFSQFNLQQGAAPILGIVGMGNIGVTLKRYATQLGFGVLCNDPLRSDTLEAQSCPLDELLARCDIISLHVPLTSPEQSAHPTLHLISEHELTLIKTGALLINTSRGPVVSERALIDTLKQRQIDTVLDVFEYEPSVSAQLLGQLSLATPHIAGYSVQAKANATAMVASALFEAFGLSGDPAVVPFEDFWLPQKCNMAKYLDDWYRPRKDEADLKQCLTQGMTDKSRFELLRKNYALRQDWAYQHSS